MTDNDSNIHGVDEERNLPTPRFDDGASASAQPVQPIPRTGIFDWMRNLNSRRSKIAGNLPALALVVMSGLAMGTIGGMALVKERRPAVEPSAASDSVSELTVTATKTEDLDTAEVGATGFQSNNSNTTGPRKVRSRARKNGEPRAYRVAVIR